MEAFSAHLNKTDKYVIFTFEDVKENTLAFLDCAVKMEEDRKLSIKVYRKPTHTNQYLRFDSHHPLEHKLGVITKKKQERLKTALRTCGYPDWVFTKTSRK